MSATSIAFASWFIRNKLDIDLSPDTIDSIISRLQSSWDDFSSIHTTTTELPLAPVLLPKPKPRAKKINNILQSHVATYTDTDEQSYNIHPVITLAPLTDNLDVHDDAKANKKPTKPRAKQIIPNLVHAQSDGGYVVPKKQTKPRAKKPVELQPNADTDILIDAFQQVSLGDEKKKEKEEDVIVPKKQTKPRAKKPVEQQPNADTDILIDAFQQVSLGDEKDVIVTDVVPKKQTKPRAKKPAKPVEQQPNADTDILIDAFQQVSLGDDEKKEEEEEDVIVPKKQTKPRAKKNAILAIDSLDNDIHPVSVKRTKKQPHAPFDENKIHQKHNQPHVINTFEPTDNHNNTIIISSLHDNNSIDNSNELLEEETHLTEVFVNDVLFYFDQTHNSWFDYSLSPISDPTI